jgi:hypothetical protein
LQKENVLVFVFLRENCFLFFVPQEVCRLRASFLSFLSFSCNNCVAISVQFQKKQGNPDERTRAKKKKKRGCNFFELWNKKKSAWRASELAGILIGMPALTYFLLKNFLLRTTGRWSCCRKYSSSKVLFWCARLYSQSQMCK